MIATFQPINKENLTEARSLVLPVHSEPSHKSGGDNRVLRQLQSFHDVLRQGVARNAVSGKRVIAQNSRAVRHHECSGYSCPDFLPDALVEIAVQRFVATAEAWPVMLQSEWLDWKVKQRGYRRADALYFRNRL